MPSLPSLRAAAGPASAHPLSDPGRVAQRIQPGMITEPQGLSAEEIASRVREGRVNRAGAPTSRSLLGIVGANLVTPFNLVLGTLFALMLWIGPPQDAIFGAVLVANIVVGVVQELRAKFTLDRLEVVAARRARVIRAGSTVTLRLEEIVVDEVIELRSGEQIVVDGVLLQASGLEVNEALLTGEARPVARHPGDEVRSGSFAVAGTGIYRATQVGGDTYAARLTSDARRFSLAQSELRVGINRIIAVVGVLLIPVGALLVRSQVLVAPDRHEAIRSSVAGLVTMVPEGLVLLTSLSLAVAVARLAGRGALAQELAAVEVLARADVVCVDKTGTLTDGNIVVESVILLEGGSADVGSALATLADGRDDTDSVAIAAHAAGRRWRVAERVAFSSERRWSAVATAAHGNWALGAPEVLLGEAHAGWTRAQELTRLGQRVLALVSGDIRADNLRALRPMALVVLSERIRPDVAPVLRELGTDGVTIVVLSGDNPQTTMAIAREAGLEVTGPPFDASRDGLPNLSVLLGGLVVGRIDPDGKRQVVRALQDAGHTVAMVGDGVNDVLAMKQANVGVAIATGADAARAVAQVVLVHGGFSSLPAAIGEGRRVIANVERLATLFVIKTVYAVIIALAVAMAIQPFPFLPRHLTLIGTFTIGVPAFILALERNASRPRSGFLGRVLRFAIPAGILAAVVTYIAYDTALDFPGVTLDIARTTATLVLAGIGLWLMTVLLRPLSRLRALVVFAMAAALLLIAALPATRTFFALAPPPPIVMLAGVGAIALGGAVIEVSARASGMLAAILGRHS